MSQMGQKLSLAAPNCDFRYAPEGGLKADIAVRPKSATSGLMQRSKGLFIRSPRQRGRATTPARRDRAPLQS
jgi:hypothetical protein